MESFKPLKPVKCIHTKTLSSETQSQVRDNKYTSNTCGKARRNVARCDHNLLHVVNRSKILS